MHCYIAYKYRKNNNREQLKEQINILSQKLENLGHTTFVLGRDVQQWGHHKLSAGKNLMTMLKNIKKSDYLIALVNSDCSSIGLNYEFLCAKILGKKIKVLVNKTIDWQPAKFFCNDIVKYSDINSVDLTL